MQLNDILEENSIKAISDKTKISEENIEYLLALEFDALSKVKTLGFISIMEREYKADLSAVKAQAVEYYGEGRASHLFPIGQPVMDEERSRPKGLIIFIFLLLGVSSWYFFTQFDKKHLNDLIPFMGEPTIESSVSSDQKIKDESVASDFSIANTLKINKETIEKDGVTPATESPKTQEDNSTANADISFKSVNSIDKMKKV